MSVRFGTALDDTCQRPRRGHPRSPPDPQAHPALGGML